ncbi:hypothetical protein [Serratia fonticola]
MKQKSVWGIALKAGTIQATQVFGSRKDAEDAIAKISHLSNGFEAVELGPVNSPELPDGWKLVPVEPTRKMMSQGHFAMGGTDRGKFRRIYQAMINASPTTEK